MNHNSAIWSRGKRKNIIIAILSIIIIVVIMVGIGFFIWFMKYRKQNEPDKELQKERTGVVGWAKNLGTKLYEMKERVKYKFRGSEKTFNHNKASQSLNGETKVKKELSLSSQNKIEKALKKHFKISKRRRSGEYVTLGLNSLFLRVLLDNKEISKFKDLMRALNEFAMEVMKKREININLTSEHTESQNYQTQVEYLFKSLSSSEDLSLNIKKIVIIGAGLRRIPELIKMFKNIEHLDLSQNKIKMLPYFAFNFSKNLKSLYLQNNEINYIEFTSFFGFENPLSKSLETLYLYGNPLDCTIPSYLNKLELKVLKISFKKGSKYNTVDELNKLRKYCDDVVVVENEES